MTLNTRGAGLSGEAAENSSGRRRGRDGRRDEQAEEGQAVGEEVVEHGEE
jgi:hypothetical protein